MSFLKVNLILVDLFLSKLKYGNAFLVKIPSPYWSQIWLKNCHSNCDLNQSVDFTGKIHDRDNLFDNFFMNKHTSDNLYDNFFMPNLNQYSAKNCVKQDRYLEVHSTFTTKLTLLHRTQVPTETSFKDTCKVPCI